MSIQPEGESLRKAVKWISDNRQEIPDQNLTLLVDQACLRFDLSAKESEFLVRFVAENNKTN